jgi:hypothetical protein
MKKGLIFLIIYIMVFQTVFAQSKEERVSVDWGDYASTMLSIRTRDMIHGMIDQNLRQYRYYHVGYLIKENSHESNWVNMVRFLTYTDPNFIRIRVVFNYFSLDFEFSNSQLIVGQHSPYAGSQYRQSPISTGAGLRAFARDANSVIDRVSMVLFNSNRRFSNTEKHIDDWYWLNGGFRFEVD